MHAYRMMSDIGTPLLISQTDKLAADSSFKLAAILIGGNFNFTSYYCTMVMHILCTVGVLIQ